MYIYNRNPYNQSVLDQHTTFPSNLWVHHVLPGLRVLPHGLTYDLCWPLTCEYTTFSPVSESWPTAWPMTFVDLWPLLTSHLWVHHVFPSLWVLPHGLTYDLCWPLTCEYTTFSPVSESWPTAWPMTFVDLSPVSTPRFPRSPSPDPHPDLWPLLTYDLCWPLTCEYTTFSPVSESWPTAWPMTFVDPMLRASSRPLLDTVEILRSAMENRTVHWGVGPPLLSTCK